MEIYQNNQLIKFREYIEQAFYEFDKNIIFLTFDDALALLGNDEKSFNLEIFLNEPLKADKVKIEIQNQNNDLFVYSWTDLNKSFFSALKVERNVMFIILTLIIIVAAFNIISGLTILIKNKTKEIAILKILGMSNLSIQKTFFDWFFNRFFNYSFWSSNRYSFLIIC